LAQTKDKIDITNFAPQEYFRKYSRKPPYFLGRLTLSRLSDNL